MTASTDLDSKKPIKEISGKNYVFPFGKWINHKVYEVIEQDPEWLLANDGIRFNLHPRIRDAVKSEVSNRPTPTAPT